MTHEHYAARRHPEFVVLEIGDDFGALIVHTEADMHAVEIEISPASDDASRTHKEVLERVTRGRSAYTAVFDRLASGAYTLWADDVARVRGVQIEGGRIAELSWPAMRCPAAA